MKHMTMLVALAALMVGAAQTNVAAAPPKGKAAAKKPAKAVCAVCKVKEGSTKPEEVKATLKYKGKTYPFCSVDEKAEFISNPAKYAK
jgi:YHS domain-containing protein